MRKIVVSHVQLILHLPLYELMSLLLCINLLSRLSLLSLILVFKVDSHQYLIFLKCLHLIKVLIVQTTSESSPIFLLLVQIHLSHEFFFPFHLRHRRLPFVSLLRIDHCI